MIRLPKSLIWALGLALIWSPAQAERVSLSGIDGKLDALLAPMDPSMHVTLIAGPSLESTCGFDRAFFRVNLDGTRASDEFVVPAGHTLMLYDVSWQTIDNPTSFMAGRTLTLRLIASNPNGSALQTVYFGPKVDITTSNQNGVPGASESLRAGVAIGEGRIVCASIASSSQSGGSSHTVTASVLRGMLIENP